MTIRYDPFEQMSRMFDQTRQSMGRGVDTNVTVEQTDERYVVMADLPGFEKTDLDVAFDDGVLTIDGETAVTDETGAVSRRRTRSVHERLSIPGEVDAAEITASYHNGVLEISLPSVSEHDDAYHIDIE